LQGANPSRQRIAVVGDEAPQLGCQGALLLRVKFKAHGGGGGLGDAVRLSRAERLGDSLERLVVDDVGTSSQLPAAMGATVNIGC
jgi:hypothetical protein